MSLASSTAATSVSPADPAQSAPAIAIASVILSTALVAVGNGLMFAFVPVRLAAEGFPPTWAGLILTGLSAGGMAGCFLTGRMVNRVGHARAYMIFSALIILSSVAVSVKVDPALWIPARALYGFAISGLFIVAQSWLNDVVENHVRGRVIAIFYVSYIVGLGAGSYLLTFIDIMSNAAPVVAIAFGALSIIPVGLTRLRTPPPPPIASIALRRAWQISPVGLAGMLAVGGLSMMVAGFAPIHATAIGFSKDQVALLLLAMPLGTMLVQLPLGWMSDRTDRRYVLVAASVIVIGAGALATGADRSELAWMILVYMVWSGATESIYSISSAHANDRAEKDDLVLLSSTMLFTWSLSGFVIPGIATALTAFVGTGAFITIAIAIAAMFCVFVIWRLTQAEAVPAAESGDFAPLSAQAPPAAEFAYASDETVSGETNEPTGQS
ncbi:MFS transporter [Nitratireductor sp. CAU 1489]|uniref:MFS transporter n=1 Tax=Nitratireductor arenosus TaxID=2682096 RepID=A0A844QAT0_9HYPH|nr:MFS transporter [Nitratireductor arenosus]MVA96292.1 MFS transporter [Nitratireductor arenosus]